MLMVTFNDLEGHYSKLHTVWCNTALQNTWDRRSFSFLHNELSFVMYHDCMHVPWLYEQWQQSDRDCSQNWHTVTECSTIVCHCMLRGNYETFHQKFSQFITISLCKNTGKLRTWSKNVASLTLQCVNHTL